MTVLLGVAALALPLPPSWEYISVRFIPMAAVFGLALRARRDARAPGRAAPSWRARRDDGRRNRVGRLAQRAPRALVRSCAGGARRRPQAGRNAASRSSSTRAAMPSRRRRCSRCPARSRSSTQERSTPWSRRRRAVRVRRHSAAARLRAHAWGLSPFSRHARPEEVLGRSRAVGSRRGRRAPSEPADEPRPHGLGYQDVIFYGTTADREQRLVARVRDRRRPWQPIDRSLSRMPAASRGASPQSADGSVDRAVRLVPASRSGRVPHRPPPCSCNRGRGDGRRRVVGGSVRSRLDSCGCRQRRLGRWTPKAGQCEGAGPDGRLTLERTPETSAARCVVRVP